MKNIFFITVFRMFQKTYRFFLVFANPAKRFALISSIIYNKQYAQKEIATEENRYPHLFKMTSNLLNVKSNLQILSYGCSTGEEVFTLHKYMPEANIYGVDINAWCLKECLRKNKSNKLAFFHRVSTAFDTLNNLDAIYCMAVFQRTENRTSKTDVATLYTFNQFENDIAILDTKLKKGGFLIIDNCDFNFTETCVADRYIPVDFELNRIIRKRPLFNKHNQKVSDTTELYRVFEKII